MEQFGRYELRRRIGVGGMAEVYEAVSFSEHDIEKPLVIKRILEEHSSDPSFRAMFIDEARVAMRLNHPNVVQVFEFGRADDRYFLAMELVRGKDLGALLSRAKQQDRTVPAGVALYVAGEVAKGLDHAHRLMEKDGKPLGIVHRDVSPQNVLLSTEGAVKIGDFGIAKFDARRGKTQAATVRGKVRYMSPEQADGDHLDARSDLFSLGVVLYEMVTGHHAFDGRSDIEVLESVRRAKPKRPSDHISVPAEIEQVMLRLLSREPAKRYARGLDMQRELEMLAAKLGLRASSGALSEFLLSLFPELEQRLSDATSTTQIRKMPEARTSAKKGEVTQIRKIFEPDGMPVYVSGEIPVELSSTMGESTFTGENTATESGLPVGAFPQKEPSIQTVVRGVPRDEPDAIPTAASRAEFKRPSPSKPAAVVPDDSATMREEHSESGRRESSIPTNPKLVNPDVATPPPMPMNARGAAFGNNAFQQPARAPAIATPPPPPRERNAPLIIAIVFIVIASGWFVLRFTPLGRPTTDAGADDPGTDLIIDESRAKGWLKLQGQTGDIVTVDDQSKGQLPLDKIELRAGWHTVNVEGRDGFNTTFAVEVKPGETFVRTVKRSEIEP